MADQAQAALLHAVAPRTQAPQAHPHPPHPHRIDLSALPSAASQPTGSGSDRSVPPPPSRSGSDGMEEGESRPLLLPSASPPSIMAPSAVGVHLGGGGGGGGAQPAPAALPSRSVGPHSHSVGRSRSPHSSRRPGDGSSRSDTPEAEIGERRSPEQGLLRLQDPGSPRRLVIMGQAASAGAGAGANTSAAAAAAAAAAAHARHMSVHSYGSAGGFESPSGSSHSDPAAGAVHSGHARHHSNRSLSPVQVPIVHPLAQGPLSSGPTYSPPVTRQLLAPSPVLLSPEENGGASAAGSTLVAASADADSNNDGDDTPGDFSSFRPTPRHRHTGSVELSPLPLLQHLSSAAAQHSSPNHTVHISSAAGTGGLPGAAFPSSAAVAAAGGGGMANGADASGGHAAPSPSPSPPPPPVSIGAKTTSPSTSTSDSGTPRSQIRSPRSGKLRPRHPDRIICGCIPWGAKRHRCSFVTISVLIVVLMVALSCLIVWLLGYYSTLSTVEELTDAIRSSVMHDVSATLNQAMQAPLQAAYDIDNLLSLRWPDLANRTEISSSNGWLADLSYVAMRYPALSRVGFATRNNIYVLITKGVSPSGVSQPSFSAATNLSVSIALPARDPLTNLSSVTLYNYSPRAIRAVPSEAPFSLMPEISNSDTPADIARYLGQPTPNFSPNFNVLARPFYIAALDQHAQGLTGGWSNVYSSSNLYTNGSFFLAIAAINAHRADDGSLGFASFAVTNLDNLNQLLQALPLGPNGLALFVRTSGRVVSSSVPRINDAIRNSRQDTELDLNMYTSSDPWLRILTRELLRWRLITTERITPRNSSSVIPFRSTVYETSVSYEGDSHHIQAAMLNNVTSGLPLIAIIITRDSDFAGNVEQNIIDTVAFSVTVAVVASVISWVVTRCISRPMMGVVDFMERACRIIEMDRSARQRKELARLCEEWAGASGTVLPPLLPSNDFVGVMISEDPRSKQRFFCCGQCCDREVGCTSCGGFGRSLREAQSMQKAFSSLLYSLASYDELEAINHAKRQFIRYIFHEVRVPFNAIVLGIEQMQSELEQLRDHSALPGALDTLGIISEQSQVVSRILNDVLSMQKIEDGALTLEYDVFSLEKMIRGSLYAFRSPCMDKRIKVKVSLTNIDEMVARELPAFRIGQIITEGPEHGRLGRGPRGTGGLNAAVGVASASGAASDDDEDTGFASSRKSRGRHKYMHRAYVRGDPYRLRQVFSNLITNAIKFSPNNGRIQVTMEAYSFQVSPYAAAANASILAQDGKYSFFPQHSPPVSLPPSPRLPDTAADDATGSGAGGADPELGPSASASASASASSHSTPHIAPPTPILQSLPLPEVLGTIYVRVSVRDSGPGVPAESAGHLFSMYGQVSAGKTQKGSGTGLGLSISKSIVELHGGQIGFNSRSADDGVVTGGRDASMSRRGAVGGSRSASANASGQNSSSSYAEFYFVLPLDLTLVKSRSSAGGGGHSSISTGSHTGSITYHSTGTGRDSSNEQATRLETIAGSPAPGYSSVHTRTVNFADERSRTGTVVSRDRDALLGLHLAPDERDPSPSEPVTAASQHVGLVHRTHDIVMHDHAGGGSQSPARGIIMQHARKLSASNRHRYRHSTSLKLSALVSAALANDAHDEADDGGATAGEDRDHEHRRIDSVVDIAPLAEAGIGVNDPDSGLERRARSGRSRSHSSTHAYPGASHSSGGSGEHSVSRSVSRIHFHEEGDPMDPTRGDWDHIQRDRRPSIDGTTILQQQRAEASKAATAAAAAAAASAAATSTAAPSVAVASSAPSPVHLHPSRSTPPLHPQLASGSSVATFLDSSIVEGGVPTSGSRSASSSVSASSYRRNSLAGSGVGPPSTTQGSDPAPSSSSSSVSPPLQATTSASTSTRREGGSRQLPQRLAIPSASLPSSNASVASLPSSVASSNSSTMSHSNSSSQLAHRSTHAIDLASFISEETKQQSRRAAMQMQQQGGMAAPPSTHGGISGSATVGWVKASQVNLSPDSAPAGMEGGSNSNPSTPFMGHAHTSTNVPRRQREKQQLYRDSCRVLVVEDSLPNRKLLVSLLARLNCLAVGVEDGQQCVDLFQPFFSSDSNADAGASIRQQRAASASTGVPTQPPAASNVDYPFDIILMDGTMPVMNGVVATQILRSRGVNIPIVAVTGNALTEDVNAFIMAGANSVLTKPINSKALQQALARFCPPLPTPSNHAQKPYATP